MNYGDMASIRQCEGMDLDKMKTLTDQFIEMRNQPQSVGTAIRTYLTEFELNGTQLNEYDISDYFKKDLPLI
jgi:hypothetical protein